MKDAEIQKQIGIQIRSLRKAKKISQEGLTEIAVLHPTYVSDIERGKVNASLGSYWAIAQALEVPLAELIAVSGAGGGIELKRQLGALYDELIKLDDKKRTVFFELVRSLLTYLNSV